jgi:hypothetical protein
VRAHRQALGSVEHSIDLKAKIGVAEPETLGAAALSCLSLIKMCKILNFALYKPKGSIRSRISCPPGAGSGATSSGSATLAKIIDLDYRPIFYSTYTVEYRAVTLYFRKCS